MCHRGERRYGYDPKQHDLLRFNPATVTGEAPKALRKGETDEEAAARIGPGHVLCDTRNNKVRATCDIIRISALERQLIRAVNLNIVLGSAWAVTAGILTYVVWRIV